MKQISLNLLLVMIFIIISCSKDKDDDNNNGGLPTETGFKETCNPVTYPGLDISIDGDMAVDIDPMSDEYMNYIACIQNCAITNPGDALCMVNCTHLLGTIPAGGAFGLTVYVTNTTGTEITYQVEPGDWFQPESGDYQPMMSPVTISEVISPGETKTVAIPVYCLVSGKSAPDEDSDYSMCDQINSNECLKDIIDILKTKDLSSVNFTIAMEIQENIWNCTEGKEVDWDYLNNLPAK